MAEIIKTPEVRPTGGIVDTYVRPARQKAVDPLAQFVSALAPAIAVEEDKAIEAKRKRDAQIASEETANKAHQIDLAYTRIAKKIESDFTENGEKYLAEKSHDEVLGKYNQYWQDYAQDMTDSGVDPLLVKGFSRKMELDMAAFGISLGDAYRARNLSKQDDDLLATVRMLDNPDQIREKATNHVQVTGNDFTRVEDRLVTEALELSKLGQGQHIVEMLKTFGKDGSNVFNKEKHRKTWTQIQLNYQQASAVSIGTMKSTAKSNHIQEAWGQFSAQEGKGVGVLSIGKKVTVELPNGNAYTFTPTFEDYRDFAESTFIDNNMAIEQALMAGTINEAEAEQRGFAEERKRFNFYHNHGKIPADIEEAITDGVKIFFAGNLADENELKTARRAYDKLEQVMAYGGLSYVDKALDDDDRNRYLTIRQLVRNGKNFKTAVSLIQGRETFLDNPYEFTVEQVQDKIDTGIFDLEDLDETTRIRGNQLLAKEVSQYATMLYNIGAVSSKEEALEMSLYTMKDMYVAVEGTGGHSTALRLNRNDGNITATVDAMEEAISELRNSPAALVIAESLFPETKIYPFALHGGLSTFELVYEPNEGNPNVANVYAVLASAPNDVTSAKLVGTYDLTKTDNQAKVEFAEQLRKKLNAQIEEEGEGFLDGLLDSLGDLFISEAGAAELTPEDISNLVETAQENEEVIEQQLDEVGFDMKRFLMEGLYRARDAGVDVKETLGSMIRSYFSDEEESIVLGGEATRGEVMVARNSYLKPKATNLNLALDIAVSRGKATPETISRIVDEVLLPIAYHESNRTLDPTIQQAGSKIAKGMFQFEAPRMVAAVKRMRRILKAEGKPMPEWAKELDAQADQTQARMNMHLENVRSRNTRMTPLEERDLYQDELFDASKLTADQQLALALYDMLGYDGDIQQVLDGTQSVEDFWAKHWHRDASAQARAAFASNLRHLQERMR